MLVLGVLILISAVRTWSRLWQARKSGVIAGEQPLLAGEPAEAM